MSPLKEIEVIKKWHVHTEGKGTKTIYIIFKGQIIHILWTQIPLKLTDNVYYLAPVKSKDKSYPF